MWVSKVQSSSLIHFMSAANTISINERLAGNILRPVLACNPRHCRLCNVVVLDWSGTRPLHAWSTLRARGTSSNRVDLRLRLHITAAFPAMAGKPGANTMSCCRHRLRLWSSLPVGNTDVDKKAAQKYSRPGRRSHLFGWPDRWRWGTVRYRSSCANFGHSTLVRRGSGTFNFLATGVALVLSASRYFRGGQLRLMIHGQPSLIHANSRHMPQQTRHSAEEQS